MKSNQYQYDRFAGCRFDDSASDANQLAAVQRLVSIDFVKGKYNAKVHGLDGVMQSCYRIEWNRLKGVKIFSFQK